MDKRCLRPGPNGLLSPARRSVSSPPFFLACNVVAALAACATSPESSLTPQPTASAPAPVPGGSSTTPPPPAAPAWDSGAGDTGAGWTDAGGASSFDYAAFQSTIQPILDTAAGKGCTAAACHGAAGGQGGFALTRQPAAGSPEMQANFDAVKALCDPAVPDQSLFYLQATTSHDGGLSAVVSQVQAGTILTWIQHASPAGAPPPPSAPDAGTDAGSDAGAAAGSGCLPASAFNLALYTSTIQPILFGTRDYNLAPGQPVANNGCARTTCHGSTTNPLNISPSNTPAQNLAHVACFVNAANPSASPILLCPLNDPGCPKNPHPGQDVFASQQDLNYQRIASWLYSGQGTSSPLDLAFFARQVAPIFTDPSSGGINGGQRTCADTTSCHGVSAVGQAPPNLSNFGILATASTKAGFEANYWSAASFANFFTPTGSELFLFPTNLVASTVNQPYATGLPHPGGLDFAPDSPQAQAILQWVGGLQPDANGAVLDWLVAGTYDATLVTQPTEVGNEATLAPTIFDPDGAAQFNGGIWDLDASPSDFVDLNAEFPGSPGSGRVAYAVANAINVTGSDIQQAQVTVTSPNAVLLYVGSASSQGSQPGNNTVSLGSTLPAFGRAKSATRIVVKVLQRPGDADFGFTLNVAQQNNQPIPPGELVFRLDPTGGI